VIVFDNRHYGETGMQESHTARAVDLPAVARGCGFSSVFDVTEERGLGELAAHLTGFSELLFARVRIAANEPPRVLPLRDGVELKTRFRRAIGVG
jgi:hypothetical protein